MTRRFPEGLTMDQHEAPHGTLATLGHPDNKVYIVKSASYGWRYVDSGESVDPEDFRSGWRPLFIPAYPLTRSTHGPTLEA